MQHSEDDGITVWGVFCASVNSPLVFIKLFLDGLLYCQLLEENFLFIPEEFPDTLMFMHDGAPMHRFIIAKSLRNEQPIRLVKWPPDPPDLSPLEIF